MSDYIKSLTILWFATFMAPILFFFVSIIVLKDQMYNLELKGLFDYIAVVLALMLLGISQLLYGQNIQKAKSSENQESQIALYRTANIIKFAMLEAAMMIAVVAHLLTQSHWLIAVLAGTSIWYFLQRPTQEKFAAEMSN